MRCARWSRGPDPEVVSFHFGLPDPALLDRVKAAGCRVMSSATTVAEALWLEAHGADAIIAQGYQAAIDGIFLAPDSYAAIVSQPGAFALIPQVADAVRIPVVAAGGTIDIVTSPRNSSSHRLAAPFIASTLENLLPSASRQTSGSASMSEWKVLPNQSPRHEAVGAVAGDELTALPLADHQFDGRRGQGLPEGVQIVVGELPGGFLERHERLSCRCRGRGRGRGPSFIRPRQVVVTPCQRVAKWGGTHCSGGRGRR